MAVDRISCGTDERCVQGSTFDLKSPRLTRRGPEWDSKTEKLCGEPVPETGTRADVYFYQYELGMSILLSSGQTSLPHHDLRFGVQLVIDSEKESESDFGKTRLDVDKPRIKEMLKARSDWACNNGLDIRFVIKLYKDIVKYSIQEQKKEL